MELKQYLQERAVIVDQALREIMPAQDLYPPKIHEAMHYSVFAGGKRLRPILCLAAAEALGRDYQPLLPVACALEMIHTYSLIHDDLPVMDDDDYRRGKLTNHKVFGEGIAVLTGDALLTYAFEILARYGEKHQEKKAVWQVLQEIATAAGTAGMIGGQVVDLESEGRNLVDKELLVYIHTHKTGALFRASLRAGALLAGASAEELACLTLYAEKFGLAFQITDDLLDLVGNQKKLGKPVGSDTKNKKLTYPTLYGLAEAKRFVREAIEEAARSLTKLPGKTEPLELLLRYLPEREF
ncbi:MAG: polyprenyl synthetase family protein [Clostridia bacterium]|jgi:geranylgeranyl diphosphate synthase type II|nr:polyprenyl synthetase family protein [Clostridia bacterium]MDD4146173.1 polyprenyl synthetase family protein [Clostridia bacterium]MDD4664942.1 polyprenyl synthetase family protein [Clostridia bacterium]